MLIAQITDLHLGDAGVRGAAGIDTGEALRRGIARLNELEPRPDRVVITGDLVDNGTASQYAHLRERLAELRLEHYLMPGNHDDREALRAAFPDHTYLGDGAFIQYEVDTPTLRLLMLDSLIPGRIAGELCATRLAWLEQRLQAAPTRPTVVFVHHPPLVTGAGHLDRSRLLNAADLGAVIAQHPQVERIACGHVHRPMAARWCGTLVTVCPSLMHQFALDLRAQGLNTPCDEGPGYQLHRWHEGSLISYTARLDR